jgi:hypothetical protein
MWVVAGLVNIFIATEIIGVVEKMDKNGATHRLTVFERVDDLSVVEQRYTLTVCLQFPILQNHLFIREYYNVYIYIYRFFIIPVRRLTML